MWVLLQSLGINKWLVYVGVATLMVGVLASFVVILRKQGSDAEKSRQLSDALKNLSQEVKHRSAVEAMKTSEARAKLKKRWSK